MNNPNSMLVVDEHTLLALKQSQAQSGVTGVPLKGAEIADDCDCDCIDCD